MSRRTSVVPGHTSFRDDLGILGVSLALCAFVASACVNTGQQIPPGDPTATGGGNGATGGNNTTGGNMSMMPPSSGNNGYPSASSGNNNSNNPSSHPPSSKPPASIDPLPVDMPGTMNDPSTLPPAQVTTDGIPANVSAILQSRCSACHTYGQGDLGGWGSVLDLSRMIDAEVVVPGSPNTSRMIDRVVVRGDMPPQGDRVPANEVTTLKTWISALRRPVNQPRADEDILDTIGADVLNLRSLSSDFRYFSLAHFVDMGRPDAEVTVAKNVLSFLVNSLSRRGTIVPMVPIDAKSSIFRVRLSDLGWSNALWDQLTGFYPYCMASDLAAHQALYAQLGTEAPFVRADWLWDTASRAPLYDQLINLPNTLNQLA
ncbi:MAG TPA: hypothetical protein VMU50_20365, partial [Polyangia bacterium]|nr:hypothetical protein [Polyangia bacterium]